MIPTFSEHTYDLIKYCWLGNWMRSEKWAFATGEALHFIGLSMLFGAMMVVDLRLLGFLKRVPYAATFKFLPFALLGFAINVCTGIMFITVDPRNYLQNPDFWVKMLLIVLAGANALWFTVAEHRRISALPDDASTDMPTKIAAALSIALWLGVVLAGRLLPTFAVGANGLG